MLTTTSSEHQVDTLQASAMRAAAYFDAIALAGPASGNKRYDWPTYPGARLLDRQERQWPGARASLVSLRPSATLEIELAGERPRLSAVIERVGGNLTTATRPDAEIRTAPGAPSVSASLIPAGDLAWELGHGVRYLRHMTLDFDMPAIEAEVDAGSIDQMQLMMVDPELTKLCAALARECLPGAVADPLYGESLVLAVLHRMASHQGRAQNELAKGGLAPWQMRRVVDFLVEDLSISRSIGDLAGLAGLSRSHFARAFKTSTGVSPYRWLIQARCEKAKQLLLDSGNSVAAISLEVGFCDQAHFTRAFAKFVGLGPAGWRRDRLS